MLPTSLPMGNEVACPWATHENFAMHIRLSTISYMEKVGSSVGSPLLNGQLSDVSDVNLLYNVTVNDISDLFFFVVSVIYVTAHRCAGGLKKYDLRSDSQRHRHFVGFFNEPVQAPTRAILFIRLFRETAPYLVAFYDTLGIWRTNSRRKPPGPHWGDSSVGYQWEFAMQIRLPITTMYGNSGRLSG